MSACVCACVRENGGVLMPDWADKRKYCACTFDKLL